MEKNNVNHPRFVRSLRWALDTLSKEARCYGYRDDPDYLEIKTYLENQIERVEGATYVKFQWSEDGITETVKKENGTLDKEFRCDYCDALIEAGSPVVKLTAMDGDVYMLHPHCAEKSCF